MFEKAKAFFTKHPMIIVLFLAGAGFIVFRMMSNSSSNSNTATTNTACTDAAGNPVDCSTGQPLAGASVSPTLSPTDLSTQFQDLQQQILNWEQSSQPGQVTPPNGPTGPAQPVCPAGAHWDSNSQKCVGDANPPVNPGNGGGRKAALLALLGINPDSKVPGASIGSWFKLPTAETTQQLAGLFGLQHGWLDIAYNPHDQFLLHDAYIHGGNNNIKAGTYVWIPTTQIPG